ncbi:neurophysin 1-like [Phymastichus coffea]|uniref:neurophysin 1-like n=1 Tax=Phymastichus coffea TaxID=108790 RepID=UPI00273B9F19|nr:neurophysin 1-like [Phymastichus coffea]
MSKLVVFIMVISSSYCCLITNCPRGGKRGDPTFLLENIARECPACGHEEQGRCFGPYICCGPTMGCLIGTPETLRCRKESLYSRPCVAGFAMCQGNSGRCAANGICCSQESCLIDSACKLVDEIGKDRKIGASFGTFLLENTGANEHIL